MGVIQFSFEGEHYTASMDFYEHNRCVLPDGRVLSAKTWLESSPPQPAVLFVSGECAIARKASDEN